MPQRIPPTPPIGTILVVSNDESVFAAVFGLVSAGQWRMREACDLQTALSSMFSGESLAAIIFDADMSPFVARLLVTMIRGRSISTAMVIVKSNPNPQLRTNVPVLEKPLSAQALTVALNLATVPASRQNGDKATR